MCQREKVKADQDEGAGSGIFNRMARIALTEKMAVQKNFGSLPKTFTEFLR